MPHGGDLQPIRPPDYMNVRASQGRYSARRSGWRFAIGSLELAFDRASERIEMAPPRPAQPHPAQPHPAPPHFVRPDLGWRLMALIGTLATAALVLAGTGWFWASRGAGMRGGQTLSAAIIQHDDIPPDRAGHGGADAAGVPSSARATAAAASKPVHLSAVIEQGKAAPAMAPSPRAAVPIAAGQAIQPQAPAQSDRAAPPPDEAIVSSGNFLLIPPVARAVSQAVANGEAKNWVAGPYHGVVVVGDVELRDGKRCRQGTVLLRDGSAQGRTQRFERCAPAAARG